MPYRRFIDSSGRQWVVWEVQPTSAERRSGARRALPRGMEDRRRRQVAVPEPPTHRGERNPLPQGLGAGWLTFECEGERRRMFPIPAGWDRFSAGELQALLDASPIVRASAAQPDDVAAAPLLDEIPPAASDGEMETRV